MAYTREDPISFKGSTSPHPNNLAILPSEDGISFALADKSIAHVFHVEGNSVKSQQRISYKHPSLEAPAPLTQVRCCQLDDQAILVLTCFCGIQICDMTGEAMYSYLIEDKQQDYTRGITCLHNTVFVGTSAGKVLRFSVTKGDNKVVTQQQELTLDGGDQCAVYCLDVTYNGQVVCGDILGNITVWAQPAQSATVQSQFDGSNGLKYPCVSLCCYKDLVIGGYGSGHIRMFDVQTGQLKVEVCAHAQWINALHVVPMAGLVLSVSEDSTCSVWNIDDDKQVTLVFSASITNVQLHGGQFCDDHGNKFIISGYEESQIFCYTKQ